MEKYILENISEPIVYGEITELVYKKHINAYGEQSARKIREDMKEVISSVKKQIQDPTKNNNTLFVGKVQSGKTSNLEMYTALAIDNGYNFIVLYGGYDKMLLRQTKERFMSTFDAEKIDYSKPSPAIFCTDEGDSISAIEDDFIEEIFEENKAIILIAMNRPVAIKKINEMLSHIDLSRIKSIIIDDEGDQASLNIASDKENDMSSTYASIVNMKEILNDPMYISVTATPQANIFLDAYSELRPDSIHLIYPGLGYCGSENFHLNDDDTVKIIDSFDLASSFEEGNIPSSLKSAVHHFLLGSALMNIRGKDYSDMIVHSHRLIDEHSSVYNMINSLITTYRGMYEGGESDQINLLKETLKKEYFNLFSEEITLENNFEEVFKKTLKVIKRVKIVLQNGPGKFTQQNLEGRRYKIYIGGDLLQRGLTFKNLITTYFTRWANAPKMDTNLQRARWFGYRESYIDLCKIFTSEEIAEEFINLAEIENDLWDQFQQIESGELNISDIIIDASKTKQTPTSKTKADFEKQMFVDPWRRQRLCVMDEKQIERNTKLINQKMEKYTFIDTCAGSKKKDKCTGEYIMISSKDMIDIIKNTEGIFQNGKFDAGNIINVLETVEEVPFIKIKRNSKNKSVRTLMPGTSCIKVLQQGAGSKDNYMGDKHVLIDKNKINVQLFEITPKDDVTKKELDSKKQYFFAIYIPGSAHSYFTRR